MWSQDPWERDYSDVEQFQDHISGKPVSVGLFRPLGRWYDLPFSEDRPFVLGEEHNTPFAPIMEESNRTGTILNESNGSLPIEAKQATLVENAESAEENQSSSFKKAAMESVFAKTLFGVTLFSWPYVEGIRNPETTQDSSSASIRRPSAKWIEGYKNAPEARRGRKNKLPYFRESVDGPRVFQGYPGADYNVLATMRRVKKEFIARAEQYIDVSEAEDTKADVKEADVKETVDLFEKWWECLEKSAGGSEDASEAQFSELREKLLGHLRALFEKQYKEEKKSGFDARIEIVKKNMSDFSEGMQQATAMRDLAMLTAIKNTSTDWQDYEMIVAGDIHVKNWEEVLTEELGLDVIPREEFILDWSEDALPY